jgi:hypothetical protein
MSLSGIFQFLIGFVLGISLLVGSGAAAAYYFFTKLAATPPKPTFAEEQPQESPVSQPVSSPVAANSPQAQQPSPSPTPSESPTPELPPGAYKARVTWPEGLSLRDGPSLEANRIGGVAFNREIIILEVSSDQNWQKVRFPNSDRECWVKAGNVEKINE